MPVREWLTIDQVADELNCSSRTVRRLISTKQLRAYHIGIDCRLVRIDRSDFDNILRPVS